MDNFISWYNRNRKRIWITFISTCIIGYITWKLINLGNERMTQPEETISYDINTNTLSTVSLKNKKSAVSNEKLDKYQGEEIKVIDNFVSLCNNKKIQDAYNLLSEECKEELYGKNIKTFYKYYYSKIFANGAKSVSIENWSNNIYKVDYNEDFLATGELSNENSIQEYITVVKDTEGNYKLNINKYIGRTELNATDTSEDVTIKVVRKDSYMDYEYYTYQVTNNTDKPIELCDNASQQSTYLLDENNLQYTSYINELSKTELAVYQKQTRTIKIKYYNEYRMSRKIKSITFSRIILDYNSYLYIREGDHFKTTKIVINL